MRRLPALAALVVAAAVTAACSDRSTDGFAVVNDSDADVTVTLVDGPVVDVGAGHREVVEMDDCLGTGVVVTSDAHADVAIDGAACTGSVLYVREDGSAYVSSMYG